MGGAPPPRSGIGVLPHFPPQRNPTCTFPPTNVHHRPPGAHRKGPKSRDFGAWGISGAIRGEPVQDHVPIAVLHASLPLGGPSVRRVCTPWGAVGHPSIDLRWGWARLLRCVAMKTTRLLVLTLVLALSAAIAAGCGSSSGSGGDDDPAALIPAGAPALRRGRRAPRRQGPQRPRGRAEEDPAHRRSRREDPAADRRAAARATTSPSRTTSSRGSATASASPSPRCTTAGTPTTRRSSTPRTTARPSSCWPSRRAPSSAPTRAPTTASTPRRRRRPRSSTTASWSPPRAA